MDFVLHLLERESHLGRSVELLQIDFVSSGSTISKDYFVHLIKKLPNLQSLFLSNPSFPDFHNEGVSKLVLPSVIFFQYENHARESHNPLSTFLSMLPNLVEVNFYFDPSIEAFSLPTTQPCLPLYALTCNRVDLLSLWNTSFLPDTSLIRLQFLEILSSEEMNQDEKINTIRIIQLCSSTLLELTIRESTQFEYDLFMDIIPLFKVLERFEVDIQDLPPDILQILPTSISFFTLQLLMHHLEHFKLHPRPSFIIEYLFLGWWDDGILELVPNTVVDITVRYAEISDDFDDLNEILSEFKSFRQNNVKSLEFSWLGGELVEEAIKIKKAIVEFQVLGIEVEIVNY